MNAQTDNNPTTPKAPVALVDYLRLATQYLAKCGSPSARLDAELLLADVLGTDRMGLYVHFDRPLDRAEVDRYRHFLRRRCQGTPVAYIVGCKEFYETTLTVNPSVLIPRPETELLVDAVLERIRGQQSVRAPLIADIGTGSGAIAIALALQLPDARIAAVDVSSDALAVAKQNALAYDVLSRIEFIPGDLLTPLLFPPRAQRYKGRLDVVVSNPPYIPTDEWERLPVSIKKFEPRLALDGGPDGLSVYRRLVPDAAQALAEGGLLALEIGSDQGNALTSLLQADVCWEQIELLQDYAGHDRIVLARKGERRSDGHPPACN